MNQNLKRRLLICLAVFLIALLAACESAIPIDLPEVKAMQKNILERFTNIERVTMKYGENSKDISLSVYGKDISEEDTFSIVCMVRDMAVQKDFQDDLIETVNVYSIYLTPQIHIFIHDSDFTIPSYPDAPPDVVTHCHYDFCSSYYDSPVYGDFSDTSQVRFIGYREWNGIEKISEYESRDIFWDEIQARAHKSGSAKLG